MAAGIRHGMAREFSQALTHLGRPHQADGDLLTRFIAERDEQEFAALVSRHGPLVMGICRRIVNNRQLAEDAFQAIFLVLAQKAQSVYPRDSVRVWLHGVATRIALRARRAAGRRERREVLVGELPDVPCLHPQPPDPDVVRILHEEIRRLPEHLRAAVVLCELDGLGRRDSAARLRIPEGTLSSRLAKARRILAHRLLDRGVVEPLCALIAACGSLMVPATLCQAAVKNACMSLKEIEALIPSSVRWLSLEGTRSMTWIHFKIGFVFSLVVLGGVFAAASHDDPIPKREAKPPIQPLVVAPAPRMAPKDLVLSAWEAAQKNLKSGSGEGIYEISNGSKSEPAKYAVKVYFSDKKFRVELEGLNVGPLDRENPSAVVLIYDGESSACRVVDAARFRPRGEEAYLFSVQDEKSSRNVFDLVRVYSHFNFNPTCLQSSVVKLPQFLLNCPKTVFTSEKAGVTASYRDSDESRVIQTIRFPESMGYNTGSYEVHRIDGTGFRYRVSAKWHRSNGTWYVREIEESHIYPENPDPADRYPLKGVVYNRLTYTKFSANCKVDPALFQLPSLELVNGARLIHWHFETKDTQIVKSYINEPKATPAQADESLLQGLKRLPEPYDIQDSGKDTGVTSPKKER